MIHPPFPTVFTYLFSLRSTQNLSFLFLLERVPCLCPPLFAVCLIEIRPLPRSSRSFNNPHPPHLLPHSPGSTPPLSFLVYYPNTYNFLYFVACLFSFVLFSPLYLPSFAFGIRVKEKKFFRKQAIFAASRAIDLIHFSPAAS